jgi:hypothetical protein
MSLVDFLKDALGFGRRVKPEAKMPGRFALREEKRQKTVSSLRNRTDPARQKHIDWLRQRKQDLLAGAGSGSESRPDSGSDTGDGQGSNRFHQKFPGKMPIRATAEALERINALKADEGFDSIQFPPVFRDGEEIIAVNLSDRSADRPIGVVSTEYETDSNPASLDKIGITLDVNRQSGMLSCVVLYPAIPTGLAVQSQSSSVNQ